MLGLCCIFSDVTEPVRPISVKCFAELGERLQYLPTHRKLTFSNFQELYEMF